jgi:hypothetical protein
MNTKILVIGTLFTIAFTAFLFWPTDQQANTVASVQTGDVVEVVMYKNPNCGCCTKWAGHMNNNNFKVDERPTEELNKIKMENGISSELASCHTAFVGGYIVEGHVPAKDVQRLLDEKPEAIGITVPGMPAGSPGMEMEGRAAAKYDVLLIAKDGTTTVWASH